VVRRSREVVADLLRSRHDGHDAYGPIEACGDILCAEARRVLAQLDAALETPEVKQQRQYERDRRRTMAVNSNYRPL
jgi:hypothetical protein